MTTQSERDIVERLREKHKAWNEQCDKWEAGLREIEAYDEVIFASTRETVYGEAADLIASLRKELEEANAKADEFGAHIVEMCQKPNLVVSEARRIARKEALEEAAAIAKTEGVYSELNIFGGGPGWYKHGQRIASAIRRLAGEERKK